MVLLIIFFRRTASSISKTRTRVNKKAFILRQLAGAMLHREKDHVLNQRESVPNAYPRTAKERERDNEKKTVNTMTFLYKGFRQSGSRLYVLG